MIILKALGSIHFFPGVGGFTKCINQSEDLFFTLTEKFQIENHNEISLCFSFLF